LKKSNLETGMRVTLRNGDVYFVLLGVPVGAEDEYEDILYNANDFIYLKDYDDELWDRNDRKYDIIKVEYPICIFSVLKPEANHKVLWIRPTRELKLHEIEKELGCSVRIIGGTE